MFADYASKFLNSMKYDYDKEEWNMNDPHYCQMYRDCLANKEKTFQTECFINTLDYLVKAYVDYSFYSSYGRSALFFLFLCCKMILGIGFRPDCLVNVGGNNPKSPAVTQLLKVFEPHIGLVSYEEAIDKIQSVNEGLPKHFVTDVALISNAKIDESSERVIEKGKSYLYGEVKSGHSQVENLEFQLWHQLLGGIKDSDSVYGIIAEDRGFKLMQISVTSNNELETCVWPICMVKDRNYNVKAFLSFVKFILHLIRENHEA